MSSRYIILIRCDNCSKTSVNTVIGSIISKGKILMWWRAEISNILDPSCLGRMLLLILKKLLLTTFALGSSIKETPNYYFFHKILNKFQIFWNTAIRDYWQLFHREETLDWWEVVCLSSMKLSWILKIWIKSKGLTKLVQ